MPHLSVHTTAELERQQRLQGTLKRLTVLRKLLFTSLSTLTLLLGLWRILRVVSLKHAPSCKMCLFWLMLITVSLGQCTENELDCGGRSLEASQQHYVPTIVPSPMLGSTSTLLRDFLVPKALSKTVAFLCQTSTGFLIDCVWPWLMLSRHNIFPEV
jgi:hypothetical protein